MSRGRCAGCGYEDASCKKVRSHVQSCPEFVTLFKEHPERAIDPEDEYVRWKDHTESFEYQMAKDEAKTALYAKYREDAERKLEISKDRFRGGTKFRSAAAQETVTMPPSDVPFPAVDPTPTGDVIHQAFIGTI